MSGTETFLQQAKRIQALAEIGKHYAESDYDLDRYTEIEKIAMEMISTLVNLPIEKLNIHLPENNGYRTPKVDIRAVVFNEKDEILMVKENVDSRWSLPGGWADIGFTPAEIAVKETYEEAGMNVEPVKILAVFDKKCHNHPPDLYYAYKIFIECKPISNSISTGYETLDAGFFSLENIPELSSPRNTIEQIRMMFLYRNGKKTWPHIDLNNE